MEESREVYSEIVGVLIALGNKYIKKIPSKIMSFLMENCDYSNIPLVDRNKRIEEQKISEDARMFLTMLKLKYWCDSESEKNELVKKLKDSEEEYQQKLKEKYNPDLLFKNAKTNNSNVRNEKKDTAIQAPMIKIGKNNFLRNFIEKIKSFIKSFNKKH